MFGKLYNKFFGKREKRLLFLGLDASGRTTALYKMKLGEVVQTIPTIGFNVETYDVLGFSVTAWDVGGCDKIRPLWRHYFANTDGVVFFVDSYDRDRLPDAAEELMLITREGELRGVPILVFANKQDLPNAMSAAEITTVLGMNDLRGTAWHVQPSCARSGDGLFEGMRWLMDATKAKSDSVSSRQPKDGANDKDPDGDHAKSNADERKDDPKQTFLLEWLNIEDEPDEEFVAKVDDYTLDKWDHRTHLRLAWIHLTRLGRKKAIPRIFDAIRLFIENSPRTNGKTFHETLTYFWVHMIHYAMEATKNPLGEGHAIDFKTFLFLNPQLSNFWMFLDYYKKETMLNNAEARKQMILPDVKPLPSLMASNVAKSSLGDNKPKLARKDARVDTDEEFLARFEAKALDQWSHKCLLRVIWTYLHQKGRRAGVQATLDGVKHHDGAAFHLSITYFWIQMVSYVSVTASNKKQTLDSFSDFSKYSEKRFPELFDSQLFREYFSDGVIFAKDAESEMVLPDLKPLPNVVRTK